MKKLTGIEALFFLFVVAPLSVILSGWTVTVLWDWFIVTTFKLVPLTIIQALGISLIAGYLTHQPIKQEARKYSELVAFCFAKPIMFLIVGWIIHLFM